MKKIILLLFLNSLISFSQSKTANVEIENLHEEFNTVLKKYYPAKKLGASYKLFLSDLNQKKVNPQIIKEKNVIDAFLTIRKTPSFYKIWKKDTVNPRRKNVINYESDFYKKLVDDCEDQDSKKLLKETGEALTKLPDLNPFIIVGSYVENLKDKHYDIESVQKAISLTIYYDIVEQFTK